MGLLGCFLFFLFLLFFCSLSSFLAFSFLFSENHIFSFVIQKHITSVSFLIRNTFVTAEAAIEITVTVSIFASIIANWAISNVAPTNIANKSCTSVSRSFDRAVLKFIAAWACNAFNYFFGFIFFFFILHVAVSCPVNTFEHSHDCYISVQFFE